MTDWQLRKASRELAKLARQLATEAKRVKALYRIKAQQFASRFTAGYVQPCRLRFRFAHQSAGFESRACRSTDPARMSSKESQRRPLQKPGTYG